MASEGVERPSSADSEEAEEENQAKSSQEKPDDADAAAVPGSPSHLPPTQRSSGSSPSSSHDNAADVLANLLAQPDSNINVEISRLKEQRDALKKERNHASNDIRNQERKRARLRARARLLSSNDLLEVFAMRRREQKKKEAQAHAPEAAEE